mmetsp:Transcript_18907/g.28743  ORF Transcript_18907/g.28743 Transcript_18907/m.28743 type:complete len:203 (+) Transcript_18907:987-1595(+)
MGGNGRGIVAAFDSLVFLRRPSALFLLICIMSLWPSNTDMASFTKAHSSCASDALSAILMICFILLRFPLDDPDPDPPTLFEVKEEEAAVIEDNMAFRLDALYVSLARNPFLFILSSDSCVTRCNSAFLPRFVPVYFATLSNKGYKSNASTSRFGILFSLLTISLLLFFTELFEEAPVSCRVIYSFDCLSIRGIRTYTGALT